MLIVQVWTFDRSMYRNQWHLLKEDYIGGDCKKISAQVEKGLLIPRRDIVRSMNSHCCLYMKRGQEMKYRILFFEKSKMT